MGLRTQRILAADVGGTNTRLAVVELPSLRILKKEECPTREIEDFTSFCKGFLGTEKVDGISVGAAGPVEGKKGKRAIRLINAPFAVQEAVLRKLAKRTLLANDFTMLGHALGAKGQRRVVRKGSPAPDAPCALLGPGTGLGACIILGDGTVAPGEGNGHSDLGLRTPEDYAIAAFIRAEEGLYEDDPVWWEHLLSGAGLVRLHRYVCAARHPEARPLTDPGEVANGNDAASLEARTLFVRFLARKAREMVLNGEAFGGVFLAGGIVQRNPDIIGDAFLAELSRHPHPRYQEQLVRVPVTLILDQDAGLKGAALALKE